MNEVDVNTVTTRKQYLKRSFRPNFERKKQLFNGAIAIKKATYNVTSILDLSKVLMLGFHYNYIKNKYGDKIETLPTDINSLLYKIGAENVYEDFYNDFSNYPKDSKYYNNSNNLVLDKINDETCGMVVKAFVRLKSKMYTFITEYHHEYKIERALKMNKNVFFSIDHI